MLTSNSLTAVRAESYSSFCTFGSKSSHGNHGSRYAHISVALFSILVSFEVSSLPPLKCKGSQECFEPRASTS